MWGNSRINKYLIISIIILATGVPTAYAITITLGGDSILVLGILNMMGNKITNVGTPTLDSDAATKAYVDLAPGVQGATGPAGVVGPSGATGPAGPTGPAGADGTIITTNHVTSSTAGGSCFTRPGGLLFVFSSTHGWCPDGSFTDFIIPETSVSKFTSVIAVTIHVTSVTASPDNCEVRFLQDGVGFLIRCAIAPSSSSELHYVIFN